MTVRTIVVGVDGSAVADAALRWAVELATQTGARVLAVHGFEPLAWVGVVEPPVDFVAVGAEVSRRLATEWMARVAGLGVAVEPVVREGGPIEALVTVAAEVDADLIVVGTRGHRGLRRLVLGSTAARLPAEAGRPVVIVPPVAPVPPGEPVPPAADLPPGSEEQ
jgi:nucleotide-binding universal stress UspA family protein